MSEIKLLKSKELEAMSEAERKNYYKNMIDALKLEAKKIDREIAEKAKKKEAENRKRINHAMYLIAGELFNSEYILPFLKDLSMNTRFTGRHTEDLNLLMKEKGYDEIIKFIPCPETEKKEAEAAE